MTISQRDKKYIWHPLNQHKLTPESIAIVKAEGVYLYDENGNKYIDGISSWYTASYGHCNPKIIEAVKKQLGQLNQVVFSGFTHEPAVKLSEKLMEILPSDQQKIFFSDNGSTAVEVGIKLALQYFGNKKENRTKILALENGFHGDTFGAMAASADSVYNHPFRDFLVDVKRIPVPTSENIENILSELLNYDLVEVAGFVYEPIVQGAYGMKVYDVDALNTLLSFLKEKGIILIADEVMTGFGKTGKYFASDWMEIQPDIMCFSKALTAGVVPMAVTSCSQHIYEAFYDEDISKAFFHAHTYSANPVACSAAITGLEILISDEIQANIQTIEKENRQFLNDLASEFSIENTRALGAIAAFEVKVDQEEGTYGKLRDKFYQFFMEHGVYLRPLGNTIYWLPPFTITKQELHKIHQVIKQSLKEVL